MSKEKKPLTKKQIKNRQRVAQYGFFVAEFAVVPIPFFGLMIANRDEWFSLPDTAWKIGLGASLTIATMVAAIVAVMVEANKQKDVNFGFAILIVKWIMATIIISVIEQVLHQISTIMWIALSGLAASYGFNIASTVMKKKANKTKNEIEDAQHQKGIEQARAELDAEETKKIKIKIKK